MDDHDTARCATMAKAMFCISSGERLGYVAMVSAVEALNLRRDGLPDDAIVRQVLNMAALTAEFMTALSHQYQNGAGRQEMPFGEVIQIRRT
jgi:hypothetical protein